MTTVRARLLTPVLAAALLLAACSSDTADGTGTTARRDGDAAASTPAGTSDVLSALADDVIVPGNRTLVERLSALADDTAALCADPSEDHLAAVQGRWRRAVEQWQATRPAAIGPADDLRLMSAVGFEARPKSIDELLAGDGPVDEASVAAHGATVRGLYAVEHVLFGPSASALASDAGARSCSYLASVTAIMVGPAEEVAEAWEGGFAEEFAEGIDGEQQMSVAALVNEVTRRVQEVDEKGLRDLAAAESIEDLKPARRDGNAAHSMAARRALLEGAAALLGAEGSGIVALVAARSAETSERLAAAVVRATEAMAQLPDAAAKALADRPAVQAASDAVAALKVVISTEVAAQLGVTITFSDADGDA